MTDPNVLTALHALGNAVTHLRDWCADHTPGVDHSQLYADVGEYLNEADRAIAALHASAITRQSVTDSLMGSKGHIEED